MLRTKRYCIRILVPFVVLWLNSCTTKKDEAMPLLPASVTWSEHIAPLIYKNCTPCHRPGEAGPFPLITYNDAVKKASLIRFSVKTKYMPPWPADPSYSHFADERILTEHERELIIKWVENDTPRGDSLKAPAAPHYYRGSFFGKPDLVIHPQKPIQIKGNGTDAFLIIKYPYLLEKDTLIDFVEFVPDQRKLIHHVNGHLISYDDNRKFEHMNGESVHYDTKANLIQVYEDMNIPYKDALEPHFPTLTPNTVYYLPGYVPPAYPKEIGGYRMKKKGAFILNNAHYGPSPKDTTDRSVINVFFRKDKILRPLTESQLGTFGIAPVDGEFIIPANEVRTFHTSYVLPADISLISVNPHMHLIGKTFVAYALKPGGDTVKIIRINKWDFRWQYYYTFKNPMRLEKGSVIHVYGTFDNTKENLNNPFHPPRTITNGNGVESMKTTEEMFQFIFTYMRYRPGDEKIDLQRKNSP